MAESTIPFPPPVNDPSFEMRREVAWLIFDTARMMTRSIERHVRSAGVSSIQWRVLLQIARQNGQTQSHLAEEVEIAPAPLGRLLDRLEEQKFIERRPDPADRRVKRVYFTGKEQGQFFDRLRQLALAHFEKVYSTLDDKDLQELQRLLQKIKSNMTSGPPGQPPVPVKNNHIVS